MSTNPPRLPDNNYFHGVTGMAFGFIARSLQNTRAGFPKFYKPWHHLTSMAAGAFLLINYHKMKNHVRRIHILNELYLGRVLPPEYQALVESGSIIPEGYDFKTIEEFN